MMLTDRSEAERTHKPHAIATDIRWGWIDLCHIGEWDSWVHPNTGELGSEHFSHERRRRGELRAGRLVADSD